VAEGAAEAGADSGSGAVGGGDLERMIIWNAEMVLDVDDTQAAMERAQNLARELGGYTVGSESWLEGDQLHARLILRIPADRYEAAMARLRDLALKVQRESASSEDVTDQYVDLESQLRHLQAKEAQLNKFLEQAEDTEAVLAVYEQLAATQAEIEQVKGRMSYLDKLSAMATIVVELHPKQAPPDVAGQGWQPGYTVRSAAAALIRTLEVVGKLLIWVVVYLLSILLLLLVPLLAAWWLLRRWQKRRRPTKGDQA